MEAADGTEALRLLGGNLDIDVLVTDLTMARTSGVELIQAAQAARPRVPAILITGNAMEAATSFMAEAAHETVDPVRKPIDSTDLAERIMDLVERSVLSTSASCEIIGEP